MDEPEKTQKLEDSREEENKAIIDDSEKEAANEETSDPVKETHEHDQEKSTAEPVPEDLDEEVKVSMESVTEREPPELPFSEESADVAKDPVEETAQSKTEQPLDETSAVSPAVEDSGSKDIDSVTDHNGTPRTLLNAEPKATEEAKFPDAEENHGESSRAVDLTSSDISQDPESTENEKPFIALTPRPLQRTSWGNCCGLFEVLRRSNC
ncbi:hypothetical protein NMG60_11021048 [Bertholletia excelsa]